MTAKLNTQWIVGFVDGEGCFRASITKNPTMRSGTQIQIEFVVTQPERDIQLLYALKKHFQCGIVTKEKKTQCARWRVRHLQHHLDYILPFFEAHSLKTKKNVEFLRFRKLCLMLSQKKHLDDQGFLECLHLAKTLPYVFSKTNEICEDRVQPQNNLDLSNWAISSCFIWKQ